MTLEPEDALRAALRPVDPGHDFTAAVLARVPAARRVPMRPPGRTSTRWAVAASLLVAVGAGWAVHQHRELQRQAHAAQQLAVALEVTNRELDRVRRRLQPVTPETGSWNAPASPSCCYSSLARASRVPRPRA